MGFSLPNYSCLDYLTTPDISSFQALIMKSGSTKSTILLPGSEVGRVVDKAELEASFGKADASL